MADPKYVIGLDFGTLSARALLVDAKTGGELACSVFEYPHGVMDRALWDGTALPNDWALQHPQDYIDALGAMIPAVIRQSGIKAEDIIGVGVDFTACTMLPVTKDGTPLCFMDAYKHAPHAYVKLWKHHAAEEKAVRLTQIARERGEGWLDNYGGKVSSEWAFPKLWQLLDEAPEIYAAMDRWIEAADWLVWQLTGKEVRGACTAGYKGLWNKKNGFPAPDFFRALAPRMERVIEEKFSTDILPLGKKAGEVNDACAKLTGLIPGTAVAVAIIDAHAAVPAAGIDGPEKMLAIMGTSTCHILMAEEEKQIPGICGVVADGVMPGYYAYEAGQPCVGDQFAWFVNNCCPAAYQETADKRGISIHNYLTELGQKQKPGESGLIALDWWNGNRSVLVDHDLTGMVLGLTLTARPEDIYRALIESTAYGTRMIIENFVQNGISIKEFVAAGGISRKNPAVMQLYADVLHMPVKIAGSKQAGALGSAIYGSVAAGERAGGYDDLYEAARNMGNVLDTVYLPNESDAILYDKLFLEYRILHDYFGRGANDVMKRLKKMKATN